MSAGAHCASCGARREAGKPFCTSCGAKHAVAPPMVPIAAAPSVPRPAPQPRALRCVECASPIDSGLVCARCAGGARAATPDARAPQTAPTPPAPQKADRQAKKATYSWGRIAAGIVLSVLLRLCLEVDWGKKLGDFKEAFSHSIDGTYVWQNPADDGSTWVKIKIDGERGYVFDSSGDEDRGRVERTGDTIRMVDDSTTSRAAASEPSKVDLARLVENGQAIEMDVDGRTMRFVKQ